MLELDHNLLLEQNLEILKRIVLSLEKIEKHLEQIQWSAMDIEKSTRR